ncbi:hypothetical protein XA68_15868 [Ophiocordyceps unilateralis]|uniref:Uncharacterized protein n=1 Tax=Ophiocordyceps unilateralis TaxID=268505 RepID=A0A2A9PPW2_OPHUN|nr:hypothetical protein XA68_15868 [Ophiocordyceps unilateralis]
MSRPIVPPPSPQKRFPPLLRLPGPAPIPRRLHVGKSVGAEIDVATPPAESRRVPRFVRLRRPSLVVNLVSTGELSHHLISFSPRLGLEPTPTPPRLLVEPELLETPLQVVINLPPRLVL